MAGQMMMPRVMLFITALAMAGCVAPTHTPSYTKGGMEQHSDLVFEPEHLDLGRVRQGEEVIGWLRIRNSGRKMAQIIRLETSCGCTVAEPEEFLVMPGGFTRVRLKIDTFAKLGEINKWIDVIDAHGRRSRAVVSFTVAASMHPAMKGESLFRGKCASCHADPARGKTDGAAIYAAVCAMCHGERAQGGYAPALAGLKDAAWLERVIAEGTGGVQMPGFLRRHGGPLDPAQIRVLAEWIVSLDAGSVHR